MNRMPNHIYPVIVGCVILSGNVAKAGLLPNEIQDRIQHVLKPQRQDQDPFIADMIIDETVVLSVKSEEQEQKALQSEYATSPEWQKKFATEEEFIDSALPFVMETAPADGRKQTKYSLRLTPTGSHVKYFHSLDPTEGHCLGEEIQYRESPGVWHTVRVSNDKQSISTITSRLPSYQECRFHALVDPLDQLAWKMSGERYQAEHKENSLINALWNSTNQYVRSGRFKWMLSYAENEAMVKLRFEVIGNPSIAREYMMDVNTSPARVVRKTMRDKEETSVWQYEYSNNTNNAAYPYPDIITHVVSKNDNPTSSITKRIEVKRIVYDEVWDAKEAYSKYVK